MCCLNIDSFCFSNRELNSNNGHDNDEIKFAA